MQLSELLPRLRERKIRLTLTGDRIRVSAPEGALTEDVRAALTSNKAELLELLRERSDSGPALQPRDSDGPAPLSLHQERIWLFQELEPEETAYNLTVRADLDGPLDRDRLARALRVVMQRHDPLRTLLVRQGGTIRQRITPVPAEPLAEDDLSHLPESERAAAVRAVERREQGCPFRLDRELPIRVRLVRLDSESHVLVVAFHHTAADGYSFSVFFGDLISAYGGEEPSPLSITYGDFAVWERERWSEDRLDPEIDFWREYLQGAPTELELPTDRPRPPKQTFEGQIVTRPVHPDLMDRLGSLIADEEATFFPVLVAAFATVLHRRSGQRDMVLGAPVAGRIRPALGQMVGMFVNQLPLRVRVPRGTNFRELIRDTQESVRSAMAHDELPFPLLVERLALPRDPSRTPFFQATVNLVPPVRTEFPRTRGLDLRLAGADSMTESFDGQSRFDLTFYGQEVDDEFHVALVYNPDLFDEETAQAILAETIEVLDADQGSWEEPLDSAHLRELRGDGVPGGLAGPDPATAEESVANRFARIAEECPGRPAIIHGEGETTYAELLRDVRRVAALTAGSTDGTDAPVGVLVPHDVTLASAILGVLTAGRPYVPLDPTFPTSRLAGMVSDAGIDLILTTPELQETGENLLEGSGRALRLDTAPDSSSAPGAGPSPESIAYLLYTSGSTGRPKAVVQSQGNLVRQADRYVRALDISPDDRVALTASISFDASLMDLFGALLSGAAIAPIDLRKEDVTRLPELIRERNLSILHFTPTVLRTLSQTVPDARYPTVRAVDLGGEAVRPEDVAFFDRSFPSHAQLVNSYGPSEHTLALAHRVDRDTRSTEVPIGRPVGDVQVVLLDEDGHPDAVVGEIALRSDYGALRYWNRPEATRKAFIPDPERPGRTLYRTGDVARRRVDGTYVFQHRADRQLKLRGHRVEPNEVEAVLSVQLSREGKSWSGRYQTRNSRSFMTAPDAETNAALINSLLEETLERMFADPEFTAFLTHDGSLL